MSPKVPPIAGIRSVEDDDNMCIVIVEVFDNFTYTKSRCDIVGSHRLLVYG